MDAELLATLAVDDQLLAFTWALDGPATMLPVQHALGESTTDLQAILEVCICGWPGQAVTGNEILNGELEDVIKSTGCQCETGWVLWVSQKILQKTITEMVSSTINNV